MQRRTQRVLALLLLCSCPATIGAAQQPASPPPAGGVQAGGSAYHVVRSVSGSRGSVQGGRYIMEDPRTIFYIPEDKQVIVYFEWEGPTGPHKFEGYWKNPDGKIAAISDFSFEAKDKRFGGYWTLTLSDTMQPGMWTLEARVDGEVTGTFGFQVLSKAKPADTTVAPRELSPAEIYKLAGSATVFIDSLNARGQKFGRGSGFFLGENIVVTAFETIDGASALRITLPNGQQVESNTVLAWNRRQDWAVLEVIAPGTTSLERAQKDSGAVGDRVFLLDSPSEGGRTLGDADIVGMQEHPSAGRRISLSYSASQAAVGGPLLNEYGKVVGVLGGTLLPGSGTLRGVRFGYSQEMMKATGFSSKVLVVPIDLVSMTPPQRVTLADLAKGGQFTAPLTQSDEIMSGVLCKHVDRKTPYGRALDETNEFRRTDTEMYALIVWAPKASRKARALYQVYDLENHKKIESAPGKLDLELERIRSLDWKIPLATLSPGIYRLDILLDGEPAWRNFFRIAE